MTNSLSSQIKANNVRVYLFMALFTMIIGILGSLLSHLFDWGLTGTSSFIIIAGIINFFAYFFSDKIVLKISRAKPLLKEQAPELYEIVTKLCAATNLPFPKLYIMDERVMNAFATGRDYHHSAVVVTKGLLEKLTSEEVEAVVAHELSHIKNYDMRLMAFVSVLVGFISLIADMYFASSVTSKVEEKDRSGYIALIGTILAAFAPLTAFFIQLAISRKREYLADASSAALIGSGKPLAAALQKISFDMRLPKHISTTTAHLYFSSPAHGETFVDRLFSTHPPIEKRIETLENLVI